MSGPSAHRWMCLEVDVDTRMLNINLANIYGDMVPKSNVSCVIWRLLYCCWLYSMVHVDTLRLLRIIDHCSLDRIYPRCFWWLHVHYSNGCVFFVIFHFYHFHRICPLYMYILTKYWILHNRYIWEYLNKNSRINRCIIIVCNKRNRCSTWLG
jgi:hypothetical protein